MVIYREEKDLRLMFEPSERVRIQDGSVVAFEIGSPSQIIYPLETLL